MTQRIALTLVVVLALVLVGVGTSTATPPPKVVICHFQEDEGTWKKISVGGDAYGAHLANHDDADPSGSAKTSKTETLLDADCQPVEACQPVEGLPCGNCLATGHGASCENCACQARVCETDPVCCTDYWDGVCASHALELCASGDDPVCTGEPACGSCVASDLGTSCESDFPDCHAKVCGADSFCCSAWDEICMAEAFDLCATVTGSSCVAP